MVTKCVPKTPAPTAEKNPVQLRLSFYSDGPAARLRQKLTAVTNRMFLAAKSIIIFDTTQLPTASPKDRLPVDSRSSVIYSFPRNLAENPPRVGIQMPKNTPLITMYKKL